MSHENDNDTVGFFSITQYVVAIAKRDDKIAEGLQVFYRPACFRILFFGKWGRVNGRIYFLEDRSTITPTLHHMKRKM